MYSRIDIDIKTGSIIFKDIYSGEKNVYCLPDTFLIIK